MPTLLSQGARVFLVVGDVAIELVLPELDVAFGGGGNLASFMPVPETAVDEDDGVVFSKNNIRCAGQILPVEAEAVACAV